MGRKRKFSNATWRGQELNSREALKRQGIKVSPKVSYANFKKRWNREHLGANTSERIIRDFYGDYITGSSKSLDDYFKRISE